MTYKDLTIHQKIGLKGHFMDDPAYVNYKALMLLWNFRVAIEYFLTDDINVIPLDYSYETCLM